MALLRRGIHFGSYGSVDDGVNVFSRLAEAVAVAEDAGFDAVSVPDHVHQNAVGGGPASPMFEAYTLLGALAMRTSSVRLLSLVSPVTLRAPGLLAKTGRDPESVTKTVFVFGAGADLAGFEAQARGFASAGADGVIIVAPQDAGLIAGLGRVLGEVFGD